MFEGCPLNFWLCNHNLCLAQQAGEKENSSKPIKIFTFVKKEAETR